MCSLLFPASRGCQHFSAYGYLLYSMSAKAGQVSFKHFIYLFLERGREGDRDREKHQCVVAFPAPPTGDLARNPSMCRDRESNQWPFDSQAHGQSTEPHQPRLVKSFSHHITLKQKLLPSSSTFKHLWHDTESNGQSRIISLF